MRLRRKLKVFAGCVSLVGLAACGEPSSEKSIAPADASPQVATAPQAPAPAIPQTYVHKPWVGGDGDKVDVADLEPLARKSLACGSAVVLSDRFNEPRAMQLGRAKREGRELRVGGQTLVDYGPILSNGATYFGEDGYHYAGVLKRLDLDVVYVSQPEDEAYKIIDAKTGTMVTINGLPLASPSGDALIALSSDSMNFVGIEVVERDSNGLKLVKTLDIPTYPCGLKWLSDTKATFLEFKPGMQRTPEFGVWDEKTQKLYGAGNIEKQNGEWIYTPAKD